MAQGRKSKPPKLAEVDLGKTLSEKTYKRRLAELQQRLGLVHQAYAGTNRKAVIVFEGWDAAGKGGAIRRIAWSMDPRGLKVWPIGAPRSYFKERHYLQRFWEKLPAESEIAIFDRSWYGRVLVERVEGFAQEPEWRRAYEEINQFEKMLMDDGARVLKFFLHVSEAEQLKRFRDRMEEPAKRWKLTADDFRNRAKRPEYLEAVDEMLVETSTPDAPWCVVSGEHKKYARIKIIETLCDALSQDIDLTPDPIDAKLLDAAEDAFGLTAQERAALAKT